ncbi:MAG: deoxyguanosine kinase [Bacillales bacterium]|jgi:deoxyadenosine/deoxycytidine kinase|nr:deoxyguanosine kinase [Bacillales bacterium]
MIHVDGVVGVGKSTVTEILAKERGYQKFKEPGTHANNPILKNFYHDRKAHSFSLQIFYLNSRFRQLKEANKFDKTIFDRSIYCDIIFAKMLHANGEMTDEELELYLDLFENLTEHWKAPKLMIYLESTVDTAIKRIETRGIDYELITERAYWETLNKNYRDFFDNFNYCDLLRINVDQLNFVDNEKDRQYLLKLVDDKLAEIEAQNLITNK